MAKKCFRCGELLSISWFVPKM